MCARQAAVTVPTYPKPKTLIERLMRGVEPLPGQLAAACKKLPEEAAAEFLEKLRNPMKTLILFWASKGRPQSGQTSRSGGKPSRY
jgi:hypothetical protein